ncbi:MAG TPA: serine hydrolase domain-containing protein [Pyrinomonadaceae bacterium]|nr:serine hydrolase domain-containing protein [Pyrinomonadaceae bacterium]
MRLKFLIILILLLFGLCSNLQAQESLRLKLDNYLHEITANKNFSGTVLVAKRNKILLDQGYGFTDLKKTVKVTSDTKFYIASITKQFTASAILKLEERGKLKTTDLISKYFKNVPPDKAQITIHHLLTHTAGLAQNYIADGIINRDEMVKVVLAEPLKNPVGEKFGYGNDGYSLLAAIVEIASGESYENYFRRNLLQPARMLNTGFWGEKNVLIADTKKEVPAEVKMPNWGFRGSGGMYSTVRDLFKWQQALFADKILSKNKREKLLTPNNQTSRGMHAYGWFISDPDSGTKYYWTAGYEDFGHNGIIKLYPDGTVIVVLTNSGDIDGQPARDLVSNGLEQIIFDNKR